MPSSRFCFALLLAALFSYAQTSPAQLSKGHQILIDRGFQILGLTQPDNYFHLDTYTNAGYTTVAFSFDSTGNLGPIPTFTGEPPGMSWARWAPNETNMPGTGTGQTGNGSTYSRTNEIPHLNQLVAVQLGDEWNLNDDTTRTQLVDWFDAVRNDWPNAILYHNNWGYQLTDAALVDYINRAHPDMINFDTYPWESVWDVNAPNHIGPAIPGPGSFQLKQWYSELRQYREYARAYGIPMGIYRQIWHGVQDYDQHGYRDPSPSELRLNTFGAIAFSVKYLNDFYYNTSAGSMFTKIYNGSGDTQISTNGLYAEMTDINKRVGKWGNTLVRLTPITTEGIPGYTTSMMFLRGKAANGNLTTVPDGFQGDLDSGGANAGYTDWVYHRNDPRLRGWAVTNKGTKNNGYSGDVIISWFKPIDESFDGPDFSNEVYLMVVNGLSDPTGSAADCLQEIQLNFDDSLLAVEMLNPLTGLAEGQALPLTNGVRRLTLNLNGGDAALFKFSDGAPFVGSSVSGPPVISGNPSSRGNVAGTDASFSARATGAAPVAYLWQFNGATIEGATTNTYTRTNVQSGDAGNYTMIASNSFGSVTSAVATLVITTQPTIQTQPQSRTNNGGTVAMFNVVADGGALSYQWIRAGTNISDGGTLSGTTTDTLTINAVAKSDATTYSVVVSNASGSVTSAPATLTVLLPMPWNEPFNFSDNVNLAGQVSGAGLIWADVGTNTPGPVIATRSGNLNVSGLATATGNSIQFGGLGKSARLSFPTGNPVTSGTIYFSFAMKVADLNGASANGGFFAGFNNSVGSQANQPSVVAPRIYLRTVEGGFNLGVAKTSDVTNNWIWDPTILTNNQTVFVVGSYTFNTGSTSDDVAKLWVNPNPATFGTVNPPPESASSTVGTDITIASFVFFQRSSIVEPAAIVADELRISTNWAGVTPVGPLAPSITTQPTNKTVFVNGNATFNVSATGAAPLSYQWQFNGGNISGATDSSYTRTNAQRYDAGNYSVRVTNAAGNIPSANALLTVTPISPVQFDSMVDLNDGRFRLQGSGDPRNFAIDASSNLVDWSEVTNIVGTSATFEFTDWFTNASQKYFRVRLSP